MGALNWTRNQVREKTDKQRIVQIGGSSLNRTAIDLNDVGDFFKCIKRDTGRKDESNQRQRNVVDTQLVQTADQRPGEKIIVFEDTEDGKIPQQREL